MRSSSLLLSLGLSIVAIAAGFASSVRRPPAISRGVPDPVPQDHHTLARGIAPSNASLADANCFGFVVVVATLGRRSISPPLVVEQSPPPTYVLLCVPPCARICLCPFVEGGAPPPPLLYSERCTMPLAGWEGRCGHVCGRWILLGGDRCVERRRPPIPIRFHPWKLYPHSPPHSYSLSCPRGIGPSMGRGAQVLASSFDCWHDVLVVGGREMSIRRWRMGWWYSVVGWGWEGSSSSDETH